MFVFFGWIRIQLNFKHTNKQIKSNYIIIDYQKREFSFHVCTCMYICMRVIVYACACACVYVRVDALYSTYNYNKPVLAL